jgi:hypothetical protein
MTQEQAEAVENWRTGHVYLSTGCLHDKHRYCQSMTGMNGEKRPGKCKFCEVQCICGCHSPSPTLTMEGLKHMADLADYERRPVLLTRAQLSAIRTFLADQGSSFLSPSLPLGPEVVVCDDPEESDPVKLGWWPVLSEEVKNV